jgi:hypothetical protein
MPQPLTTHPLVPWGVQRTWAYSRLAGALGKARARDFFEAWSKVGVAFRHRVDAIGQSRAHAAKSPINESLRKTAARTRTFLISCEALHDLALRTPETRSTVELLAPAFVSSISAYIVGVSRLAPLRHEGDGAEQCSCWPASRRNSSSDRRRARPADLLLGLQVQPHGHDDQRPLAR